MGSFALAVTSRLAPGLRVNDAGITLPNDVAFWLVTAKVAFPVNPPAAGE